MTIEDLRNKTAELRERLWSEAASACDKSDLQLMLDISRFLGDEQEVVVAALFAKLAEVGGHPLRLCSLLLLSAIGELAIRSMPEASLPKEGQQ